MDQYSESTVVQYYTPASQVVETLPWPQSGEEAHRRPAVVPEGARPRVHPQGATFSARNPILRR